MKKSLHCCMFQKMFSLCIFLQGNLIFKWVDQLEKMRLGGTLPDTLESSNLILLLLYHTERGLANKKYFLTP